jgi:UDP-N-acetylenolpyruvoylglucosamine reductase
MKAGGAARYYAEPASMDDLRRILAAARGAGVKVFVLGRGSNLIVADGGFDGLVVKLNHEGWKEIMLLGDGRLWAGGGAGLHVLCARACEAGLGGFEFLAGIPGTDGGALRMNAGALGRCVFDRVEEVHFLTPEGELQKLPRAEFAAGYRHCPRLEGCVVVGAVMRAEAPASPEQIRQTMKGHLQKRCRTQPREPSAGCVFKNPEGQSAGRMIDRLGLKGRRVGGAEVSPMHANFIVNREGAAGAEIISLMKTVRDEVKKQHGVELEPEVALLGGEWRDIL